MQYECWHTAVMVLSTSTKTTAMMMMMMMTTTMTTMTISSSPGCPAGCACKWKNGKQTVECVDKKVTSVTLALGIDPATQVLDISDNDLSAAGLPHDTFAAAGLSNLQRIHASRCNVYYVHDRAFRGLTNLVDLDLSGNCLRQVPTGAFAECPSLMKLSLSGNPIGDVPARAFRHLGQLTALDLSGCGLTSVAEGAFDDLSGLDWLRLDDNLLTHVPGPHTLPARLHGVDLHRNDWQCDCHMVDMHRWLTASRVPVTEDPVCSGPAAYANVPVRRVSVAELACAPAAYPATQPVQDVAEGVNVSFRCLVAAIPAATVEWLYGGLPVYRHNASELITVDGNTTAELYVYNASVSDAGSYACVAENRAGRARVNFTVTIRPGRPFLTAGTVDDRSAPSQSSSATSGGGGGTSAGDGRPLLYVGCLAAGSVALSAAAAVLVAIRCRRAKRSGTGGRTGDSSSTAKRRPAAPAADGYRTVSTTADKELSVPTAHRPTSARATGTLVTVTAAEADDSTVATAESNPDVVSDVKRTGWEIDFEQIVWAECPPATGYVSIQIPVQCGIECLGAYYATAAEAMAGNRCGGAGTTVRRQRRRAAVLTAYDDTVQVVRTTAQGGYPTTTTGPGTIGIPATFRSTVEPPTIVVDDPDDGGGGGVGGVAPIISPPLPFRSGDEDCSADKDDSIAL
ncbi:leucine-rich repeat-containing protein 4C-like [Myzus persicae]|uniref:leucine-rich repeat-containing protein 4C-like n=1 Tax=Myzus persicae TaxID=13164 RepID=UPI000B930458|nr:leucine-rich repeat-containing protein 4C-like [Myzus persicae]XP_022180347.1 leucine-rich repeat-containing protein 4C-like [Myzus persicae]